MSHRDALAKWLRKTALADGWDSADYPELFDLLATEALAYVNEMLGREKIWKALDEIEASPLVPDTVVPAIRALLGLGDE